MEQTRAYSIKWKGLIAFLMMALMPVFSSAYTDDVGRSQIKTVAPEFQKITNWINVKQAGKKVSRKNCEKFKRSIVRHAGKAKLKCYLELFWKETWCTENLEQGKGHAGNPNTGRGVCTLEKRADLRAYRGKDCADISTIDGQVKCCVRLIATTQAPNSYFGPINRDRKLRRLCGE